MMKTAGMSLLNLMVPYRDVISTPHGQNSVGCSLNPSVNSQYEIAGLLSQPN